MRRWLGFIALSVIGLFSGLALADYTVKDASNSTQTVFAFVCFATKICPTHVLVTSAGVEIVPATAALQTTGNTALTTINTTLGSPLQAGGTVVVTGVATAANQASIIGTKAPGTAATNSSLLGALYTAAGITLTDGQQAALQFDSTGNLKVSGVGVAQASATSGQTLSLVGAAAATSVPTTTAGNTYPLSMDTVGGLRTSTLNNGVGATAAAVPANAVSGGCRAQNAEATAGSNGNLTAVACDLVGKQIMLPYANPENSVSGLTAAMTGTTTTSLLAAPASGLRNYVTDLYCVNSHATVSTFVNIQDGSGGTTIYQGYAGAVGGGFGRSFNVALKQPTLATALFVANVTTGANVVCNAVGYKGA